jgi:hypothetical protein
MINTIIVYNVSNHLYFIKVVLLFYWLVSVY